LAQTEIVSATLLHLEKTEYVKNTATIGDFTAQPWEVVSLDFIEAMLKLQNCDVILVVLFVF
jgi:hypothetical protein